MTLNMCTFIHILDENNCSSYFDTIFIQFWFFHPKFYNPWLTFGFFIQIFSSKFIPFVERNVFGSSRNMVKKYQVLPRIRVSNAGGTETPDIYFYFLIEKRCQTENPDCHISNI
jgi:hypothetical protein